MIVNSPDYETSKLNSLKSPWIKPHDANFFTRSKDLVKISFTEHPSYIFFTWHKGSPFIRDITIA